MSAIDALWTNPNASVRVTTKEAKECLLRETVICRGRLRTIHVRNIGCGIKELYTKEMS